MTTSIRAPLPGVMQQLTREEAFRLFVPILRELQVNLGHRVTVAYDPDVHDPNRREVWWLPASRSEPPKWSGTVTWDVVLGDVCVVVSCRRSQDPSRETWFVGEGQTPASDVASTIEALMGATWSDVGALPTKDRNRHKVLAAVASVNASLRIRGPGDSLSRELVEWLTWRVEEAWEDTDEQSPQWRAVFDADVRGLARQVITAWHSEEEPSC